METHYVSAMYIQLIFKGTFVNSLICWIESPIRSNLHQLEEQLIWNDSISFNSIENQTKQ